MDFDVEEEDSSAEADTEDSDNAFQSQRDACDTGSVTNADDSADVTADAIRNK